MACLVTHMKFSVVYTSLPVHTFLLSDFIGTTVLRDKEFALDSEIIKCFPFFFFLSTNTSLLD